MGNYSSNGFGGVNAHIREILLYVLSHPELEVSIDTFNLRSSATSSLLSSFSEFFAGPLTIYPRLLSKKLFVGIDVIHAHSTLVAVQAALHARKRFGTSAVLTYHSVARPDLLRVRSVGEPYYRRLFYRRFLYNLFSVMPVLDSVIAVARWVQKDLRKYWGVKAKYIPNFINLDKIISLARSVDEAILRRASIPSKPYVVWLGARLSPVKRPCDFVALAREFPDILFVMPGRNITYAALQRHCGAVPENLLAIDTSAFENHREVFLRVVMESKAAVLTSYYEAFGYVVLEALALGVPVLVPDTGGPPEIVTPSVGAVYRTGQLDSLFDMFLDVWEHIKNGQYSPEVLRNYVAERYSVHSVAPKIFRIYKRI